MKKILSIFLAVAFVFSAMCMSVLAGDMDYPTEGKAPTAGSYDVIGNHGDFNDPTSDNYSQSSEKLYLDGDENLTDKGLTADVHLQFNKKENDEYTEESIMQNRYAVDIEYWDLVIDLGEVITSTTVGTTYSYIWNVNTYEYDLVDSAGNVIEPSDDTHKDPYEIQAFQVTNHSDMPIYYSTTTSLTGAADENMDLSPVNANGTVGAAVAAVYTYTTTDGATTATKAEETGKPTTGSVESIRATPKTDWLTAVNNLVGKVESGAVVGSMTVTITSTNPNAGGNS